MPERVMCCKSLSVAPADAGRPCPCCHQAAVSQPTGPEHRRVSSSRRLQPTNAACHLRASVEAAPQTRRHGRCLGGGVPSSMPLLAASIGFASGAVSQPIGYRPRDAQIVRDQRSALNSDVPDSRANDGTALQPRGSVRLSATASRELSRPSSAISHCLAMIPILFNSQMNSNTPTSLSWHALEHPRYVGDSNTHAFSKTRIRQWP